MSVREIINNNSKIVIGVMFVLIVGAISFTVIQSQSGPSAPTVSDQAFYTIDDGKTWFVDNADMMPFAKDGKPAYLAYVFRSEDGKEFVGYIKRYNPNAEKALSNKDYPERDALLASPGIVQVKEPGSKGWMDISSMAGSELVAKLTKSYGDKLTAVNP